MQCEQHLFIQLVAIERKMKIYYVSMFSSVALPPFSNRNKKFREEKSVAQALKKGARMCEFIYDAPINAAFVSMKYLKMCDTFCKFMFLKIA